MQESVVCDHMPKIATARNKATNWNIGGMLGKKKFYFLEKMGRSGDWQQNFCWCGLILFLLEHC